MANELQQLPNPDNVPGAVTSGYQRQNTNMFVLQTGLDTTEPFDNGNGIITIPVGGIVEANGVMFKIVSDVILAKPNVNNVYWIAVNDNGDGTAEMGLVTNPGAWNPAKQGYYTSDNKRTLNWTPNGNVTEDYFSELPLFWQRTEKGEWGVPLQKGWYFIDLTSGLGGGDGKQGTNSQYGTTAPGGAGGVPNQFNRVMGVTQITKSGIYPVKVGGNGGNGGAGGMGTYTPQSGHGDGGGGGGGGSGSGEESFFFEIMCKPISGGNGGRGGNGSTGGNPAGTGGPGGTNGQNGSSGYGGEWSRNGSGGSGSGSFNIILNDKLTSSLVTYYGGAGGGGGGQGGGFTTNVGYGGSGGPGGIHGKYQPLGSAGGYCKIYKAA